MNKKSCHFHLILTAVLGCVLAFSSDIYAHSDALRLSASDNAQGKVTYLANEAIMIESAETKLLFDPFFHHHFDTYALVPDTIKAKIMAGEPPFDNIKAIFVSHAHGDHFSDKDMLAYLTAHSGTHLYAPEQAISQLTFLAPPDEILARLHSISLAFGQQAETTTNDNLLIETVRIPHAGWPSRANVENLVFRVSIYSDAKRDDNALTVMHMGDADPNRQHFIPFKDLWQKRHTSMAFPPYWFYLSKQGNEILDSIINTRKFAGIHVPLAVPEALLNSSNDYFTQSGETRVIEK
ncbi:MBL fold metallo-hydrolase [Aliiglaciecola litoralis]|uniref:Metallo-beta-lactamase domain-containing protein n=1 Tax=Aliiglaciecola litoralis TaxID=582857 RepID=A0ABN1LEE8_9ALTE